MAAVVVFGGGALYGDANAEYGRVGSGLLTAQSSHVRQTHLEVKVIDSRLNEWEPFAGALTYPGEPFNGHLYRPLALPGEITTIKHWGFRGGSSMCQLGNGTIKRVRNGNPTSGTDRQIYIQTITDPTDASQWTTWSVLYSGSHYGTPAIIADGTSTGFAVVHCKVDGIYIDNSMAWPNSGFVGDCIGFVPVRANDPGDTFLAGWVFTVRKSDYDDNRITDLFWTENLDTNSPVADARNYSWKVPFMTAFLDADTNLVTRFNSDPLHASPRATNSYAEWTCKSDDFGDRSMSAPYSVNGIGGSSYIAPQGIYQFSDGFYYLFGVEVHANNDATEPVTNFGYGFPVWMRSKDLTHWSEPVIGPNAAFAVGHSGVIESGDYLYWASTELVFRRPTAPVEYDLSNFVSEASFSMPRDNQAGSGSLTVANPNGINDAIVSLSDRELILKPGLVTAEGVVESTQFDTLFIKQCNRQIKGAANRIGVEFGNIWDRLDNPMRDVVNFVGQFKWSDWATGQRNKAFNYYFASAQSFTELTNHRLKTTGICLFTGWKGNNPDFTVTFHTFTGFVRVILRYIDAKNYLYVEYDPDGVITLIEVDNGVGYVADAASVAATSTPTIRVRLRWNKYVVWLNGSVIWDTHVDDWRKPAPGYVGFSSTTGSYQVSNTYLEDWEATITSEDLVRTALAMGDFHDVIVGGADSRALAIIWGPQTDIQTQAQALQQALDMDKLQLIWRNGSVEVGKFTDRSVVRRIENEIISSDQVNEAKRRVNLAVVDGNDFSWIEVDAEDSKARGRQVISYSDVPELVDHDSVIARAQEVISQGGRGDSPGGTTPLFFDLARMDAIEWVDNSGEVLTVRIEGFDIEINQGMTPFQRQTFDLGDYITGSTDALMNSDPDATE